MEILLETKNLTIEYKNIKSDNKFDNNNIITAVNNVSLKIFKGEIYALAGESGCGKSTLAKAITKLVNPSCGEILINGETPNITNAGFESMMF